MTEQSARFGAKLAQLAPQVSQHVRDQHLVSKVLLKRFAGPVTGRQGPQVAYLDLNRPSVKVGYLGPSGCGVVPDFIKYASLSAEQLWATTENRLGAALEACNSGRLFDQPQHVQTIKDAIALHLVRSRHSRDVQDWALATTREEQHADWQRDPSQLAEAYFAETGLLTAGPQGIDAAAERLLKPFDEVADSGAILRVGIEAVFQQACEITNAAGLVVAAPAAGEFLIGDAPALPVLHNVPGIEPVDGLPMAGANSIVLPLGPGHLAILSGAGGSYQVLPSEWVDIFNAFQVEAAARYAYFRPGGQLEGFVRSVPRGDFLGSHGIPSL